MTDLLDTALDGLVPTFVDEHPDWPDVVARLSPEAEARVATPAHDRLSAPRRKRDHRRRFAFAAAVVVVATCLPAIALSASVREWLGFGPHPVYNKAILVVSTPIPGNRVAGVWLSPVHRRRRVRVHHDHSGLVRGDRPDNRCDAPSDTENTRQ